MRRRTEGVLKKNPERSQPCQFLLSGQNNQSRDQSECSKINSAVIRFTTGRSPHKAGQALRSLLKEVPLGKACL